MKISFSLLFSSLFFPLMNLIFFFSCNPYSEAVTDSKAGLNGGFEQSKNGLPLNWLIYSPETISDSEFEVNLDSKIKAEGNQSLRFSVKKAPEKWENRCPGFTNEFFESGKFKGPAKYSISFVAMNLGSRFNFAAGAVDSHDGKMTILVDEQETFSSWKKYHVEVAVPANQWLRVELKVCKPGELWVDDFQISKLELE